MTETYKPIQKPIKRSALRRRLGFLFYGTVRKVLWLGMNRYFAKKAPDDKLLPTVQFSHKTPLMRKLKDVDMWYQTNKVINLKIAVKKLDGVILYPGQIFSYWKLIGKPTYKKGYVDGMILSNGSFGPGVGGGLCQMSNLIFWMTLHTPLTVTERHRHGYDVFPDAGRTQPFGSGATCYYPHGDLMIRNDTDQPFQLCLKVGDTHLEGCWRAVTEPEYRYQIVEREHEMKAEYWGGYSRHNKLYRQVYDKDDTLLYEEFVVENNAIMMYSPFLQDPNDK